MRTILGFGASTMEGVGDPQGGFFKRLQTAHPSLRWVNLGIGGNTTRDLLARMKSCSEYAPYDLVVQLGCNDFPRKGDGEPARRTTLKEFTANLNALLPAIRGGKSLFVSSIRVSTEKTGITWETFEEYMAAATACAVNHGYELLDCYTEKKGSESALFAADGLHFNGGAHQWMADEIAKKII